MKTIFSKFIFTLFVLMFSNVIINAQVLADYKGPEVPEGDDDDDVVISVKKNGIQIDSTFAAKDCYIYGRDSEFGRFFDAQFEIKLNVVTDDYSNVIVPGLDNIPEMYLYAYLDGNFFAEVFRSSKLEFELEDNFLKGTTSFSTFGIEELPEECIGNDFFLSRIRFCLVLISEYGYEVNYFDYNDQMYSSLINGLDNDEIFLELKFCCGSIMESDISTLQGNLDNVKSNKKDLKRKDTILLKPNPVKIGHALEVNVNLDLIKRIRIIDFSGKSIFQSDEMLQNEIYLPSTLIPGLYVVQIELTNGIVHCSKIILI